MYITEKFKSKLNKWEGIRKNYRKQINCNNKERNRLYDANMPEIWDIAEELVSIILLLPAESPINFYNRETGTEKFEKAAAG